MRPASVAPGWMALVSVVWLAGCVTPERWPILTPEWERYPTREPRAVRVSESIRPISGAPTALPDVQAGQPVELSVEQAILLALQKNADLHVEQLTPEIVGAFEQIERGVFDPEVFADATYTREKIVQVSRSTEESFNVDGEDLFIEAGLRQRLPTGTDLALSVSQERTLSSRTPEQQESRAGLTLTQALLRGFGPAVNLAAVRQAELDTLASLYEFRGFAEALVAEVESAYWNYVLARQEIAIFEESLQIARQQRDHVEQQIEVGLIAATEAAAARAEVALREQALIDARSELAARRLRLLRLLNPSDEDLFQWNVTATTTPDVKPDPITDVDERARLALERRPELNEARLRQDQNRLEVIVTRNGLLPRLDFFVTLGRSGFADNFADAVSNLDEDTYDLAAGVRLSHFLGNRSAWGRDRAARASHRQASAAVSNLAQIVRLDVRLAVTEAERTRQQIDATTATRTLQEETVEAERERFTVGASTALLVAQAQRDLLEAQIAEVESIVNYRIALVNLYLAEGSLLERRGIRIDALD